jgi:hypothetical protein
MAPLFMTNDNEVCGGIASVQSLIGLPPHFGTVRLSEIGQQSGACATTRLIFTFIWRDQGGGESAIPTKNRTDSALKEY